MSMASSTAGTCTLHNGTAATLSMIGVDGGSGSAASASAAILPAGAELTLPSWQASLLVLPNSAQTRITPSSAASTQGSTISLGPRVLLDTVGSAAGRNLGFVVRDAASGPLAPDAASAALGRFVNASSWPVVVFGNTASQAFVPPLLLPPVLPGRQQSSFLMVPALTDGFNLTAMTGTAAATLNLATLRAMPLPATVPLSLDTVVAVSPTGISVLPHGPTAAAASLAAVNASTPRQPPTTLAVMSTVQAGASTPTVAALSAFLAAFAVLFIVFLSLYLVRTKCRPLGVPLPASLSARAAAATGGRRRFF